jgi:hypothetical protein
MMRQMTAFNYESPPQSILASCDALALTSEQRRNLELLDIDFRTEAVKLLSQRQLLELDIQRARSNSRSASGLTPELLTEFDAVTAKLRQAWLRALDQARSTLSDDQLGKLTEAVIKLPSFDPDVSASDPVGLKTIIAEAVAARVKDAKVVEIETAQAIAERLFGWAKSAALVTGIPLGLLVVVLGVLGISSWTDFTKRVADGKSEVELHLSNAKKAAEDVGAEAAALKTQYADLKKQFGDVSALAVDVKELSSKVDKLEQIQFEKSADLLPEMKTTIEQRIKEYRAYLQSIGYHPPKTDLKVVVDPTLVGNTYYDGERMVADPKLITMPDAIYREYTNRMLTETKPEAWSAAGWKIAAIVSGFADYFPCSYQGDPKFGVKYVEAFANVLPPEMRKLGYLRNLANKRPFVTDSAGASEQEQHSAGEVWSGVFWDIRRLFGCQDNSAKCETADKILLTSWSTTSVEPVATADVRLAQSIVQNIRESGNVDQAGKAREAFARRGLRLQP